jgi:hypothetical protein
MKVSTTPGHAALETSTRSLMWNLGGMLVSTLERTIDQERSAQVDPLLTQAVVEGEASRQHWRRHRGGVGEEGDLRAGDTHEAINKGGAAHFGNIGARREEAWRGRVGEGEHTEVGA